MWCKIKRAAEVTFYVLAVIGFFDMAYQAAVRPVCGPIRASLSSLFPHAPGSAKCRCGVVAKQQPTAAAQNTAGTKE